MRFISGLSLHTTIFDFIVRKGVPLIMVIQRTITGVKFPSVPCEPQIACPPQREPYGFQLHSQSGSPIAPPVTGGGMYVEGQNLVFHLRNMWEKLTLSPICLECFMVTDVTPTAPTSLRTNNVSALLLTTN